MVLTDIITYVILAISPFVLIPVFIGDYITKEKKMYIKEYINKK